MRLRKSGVLDAPCLFGIVADNEFTRVLNRRYSLLFRYRDRRDTARSCRTHSSGKAPSMRRADARVYM